MNRPATVEEFMAWSTAATCGEFGKHIQSWYEINQGNLWSTLLSSQFADGLPAALKAAGDEYRRLRRASLFSISHSPEIRWDKKPYSSFVDKLFRLNCVENLHFPEPPEGGWIKLKDAFSLVDDIVRTSIQVTYADGPSFLAQWVVDFAGGLGLESSVKSHAKEKGYYAHHAYVKLRQAVASPSESNQYPDARVPVELQITTELQGVLKETTHRLYEQERVEGLPSDWKTQFRSGRFRAAYMAHTLRFVEAMIVELRDQVQHSEDSG